MNPHEKNQLHPPKIIMRDLDGGFVAAELEAILITKSGRNTPLYRYKEYYHSLDEVKRNE